MRQGGATILVSIMLLGASAAAAQDFPEGTFASSKEGCDKLASKTPAELGEEFDFYVLTKAGVTGYQQRCDFLNVTARNATSWLASAFCDESGYIYPDLFAVQKKDDGDLNVTRMTDVAQQEDAGEDSDDAPSMNDDLNPSEIDRDEDKNKGAESSPEDGGAAADVSGGAFNTYVSCQTVKP